MKKFFLTIITILIICPNLFGQQKVISGLKINNSVTWSGTIVIEGDIIVEKNGLLTIEAGTEVLFKPQVDKTNSGNDKTRSELIIKGNLIVKGHSKGKVTFSSMASEPRMGDWYGIYIGNPKQTAIIDYAIIEYAYNGIMIKKSSPVIRNSQIHLNYNSGILCEVKSEAKITKNIISENGYAGVICRLGSKPVLSSNLVSLNEIGIVAFSMSQPNLGNMKRGSKYNPGENNIFENTEYDLYNHTKLPLLAENNSWGNNSDLNSRIYDSGEDGQYGAVDVLPVFSESNLDELILVAQQTSEVRPAANRINRDDNNSAVAASNNQSFAASTQNQNATTEQPKPLLAAGLIPNTSTSTSGTNGNYGENTEEQKNKVAEEIDPPAIAQLETERPLASLEQQPAAPEINYNQIFLEHFLDVGTKKILKKVTPKVRFFGPKGRVIVRAVVDKNGKVEEASVVKGLTDHYDQVSVSAAEKFEFATGKIKGVPVKFYTNILFQF